MSSKGREKMNSGIIFLTRDDDLLNQLTKDLSGHYEVQGALTLQSAFDCLSESSAQTLLIHLCPDAMGDHSPGHFVAEINDVVQNATIIGMVDTACPSHLKRLMQKTADHLFEAQDQWDQLRSFLGTDRDPQEDLVEFWMGLPHKELHGLTRSLVTFTPEMFEMMDEVKVAAKHDVTMLLVGETGSGKSHLARLTHELSHRSEKRFCTVACGALPPDLIESELFGYVKGAFTGADRDKEGKFAAAGTGTLLLDEIDVLSLDQQAKLLRVIETGEYEPVGSNDTEMSQARLIVASNYNLEDLVHKGTFRIDLYYRLNILKFRLLPLRERPSDIEYLARKFALEHSRTHEIPLHEIDASFFEALRQYSWPGNIREMENVIRRAVLYCQRGVLTMRDLPSNVCQTKSLKMGGMGGAVGPLVSSTSRGSLVNSGSATVAANPAGNHHLNRAGFDVSTEMEPAEEESLVSGPSKTLEARVDLIERRIIEDCLRRNNHRRKETAAELGISRVTLYNKMKKFGLMD